MRWLRRLAAVAVLACGLSACTTAAMQVQVVPPREAAWTTALGNQERAGHAEQLAPEQPEVEWRTSVGRGLRSEPVVRAGVVLVAGSNRLVAALDAATGDRYWEQRVDGSIRGGLVWRADTVWAATEAREGRLYALRLRSGGERWDRELGAMPYPLLLQAGHLYAATEPGVVAAVDAATGAVAWRTRIPSGAAAMPVSWRGELLVASKADTLYALDAATGTVLRRAPLPGTASAPPALRGDTLLMATHEGALVAVALPGLEAAWETSLGGPILAAPVVAPDGTVYALNTNAEVWRVPAGTSTAERLVALRGATRASLTLARDRLLVGRLDGVLFLLRLDGTTVWELDLEDSISAPVALEDGAVYVPLQGGAVVKIR